MRRDRKIVWHPAGMAAIAGKRVIVVGGTGGIGRAISHLLASHGADVTVVGRRFRDADRPGIAFVPADLGLMGEARRVAEELPAGNADILIFTTGIFAAPHRQMTTDGIERDLAVSYLNRFVMLRSLAPRLGRDRWDAAFRPRIFVMGYPGTGAAGDPGDLNAERRYTALGAHKNTIAGNEMLAIDLARRFPGIGSFGLNPGLIRTDIRANLLGENSLRHRIVETLIGLLAPDADSYARRIAPLLLSPDLERFNGAMFDRKASAILPTAALTPDHIDRFMAASERLAQPWLEGASSPRL